MAAPKIGNKAPDFTLPSTSGDSIRLKDLRGKKVILYFYPKDSTPGCTLEGQDFRDQHAKFKRQNALVFGISRDSIASHDKFRYKQKFKFDLLSDPNEKACGLYDVIKEKNMYGRKVIGIERSTFLIDEEGTLRHEWRKVRVKGHVDDVLATTKDL